MGSGVSAKSSSAVLSTEILPDQLFVEQAGSTRANGRYILRTGTDRFPVDLISRKTKFTSESIRQISEVERSAWFVKENDEDYWAAFLGPRKLGGDAHSDQGKWILFTAKEILYIAPVNDGEITPRNGRWELGSGKTPAPTVNLQPLPTPFRLTGWSGAYYCLNGEYFPLDDGTKRLNGRPIFKHMPIPTGVVSLKSLVGDAKYRMFWSNNAWRISENDKFQSNEFECMAFVDSDATDPSAMSGDAVWKKVLTRKKGAVPSGFVVDGVTLGTGTVRSVPARKKITADYGRLAQFSPILSFNFLCPFTLSLVDFVSRAL